jgi:hypothetical protein
MKQLIYTFGKKVFVANILMAVAFAAPLFAGPRKISVFDKQTGKPIPNAAAVLITVRQAFNPVDVSHVWRKETIKKTDSKGCLIVRDSDLMHPTRAGRATNVRLYICKADYWPSTDEISARMRYISFLKPSDLKPEHRLKKATAEEYMSDKYYLAVCRCPKSQEKESFIKNILPAKAKQFRKDVFSDRPETIILALRKMTGSTTMSSHGTHTDDILAATGKVLTHKDPDVRTEACKLLSHQYAPALPPEIVEKLLPLLADSSPNVREAAGEAVAIHGKEAVSHFQSSILNLLDHPAPEMQKVALKALFAYSQHQRGRHKKGKNTGIVSPLRERLYRVSNPEEIKTLLSMLGNLTYPEYFRDLEHFHDHPDPQVQVNVITMMRFTVSQSEKAKALPYFTKGLKSADENVRYAAVVGIKRLGDKSHIPDLKACLKTEKKPFLRTTIQETVFHLEKKK